MRMILAGMLGLLAWAASAEAQSGLLVLTPADESAYREAFTAARAGDHEKAAAQLSSVSDPILIGHVLARRLLDRTGSPSARSLSAWLANYSDHPQARNIFDLARARAARNDLTAPPTTRRRVDPLAARTSMGGGAAAQEQIDQMAQAFARRDLATVRRIGAKAALGPRAPLAHWQLALADFQDGRFADAADGFSRVSDAPQLDGWMRAAGSYWAARARLTSGDVDGAIAALQKATRWPTTFYGQLAEAQLGVQSPLNFQSPAMTPEQVLDFMAAHPGARRAAALAQLGRLSDVETELRLLHARLGPESDVAYLAFAQLLQAPAAQLRVAEYGGPEVAAGHCPDMSFAPEDGYRMDRAVVLAVLRQESKFDPTAVSRSNARGLMQLLPSTAQDVDKSIPFKSAPGLLHEPALNLRLGQAYIEWLKPRVSPNGDLAKVFAAYNGGPGWLSRWLASYGDDGDHLMTLEALPRAESRIYAERVLAFVALCRKKFGQPAREMEALAQGMAPVYQAQEFAAGDNQARMRQ
jgi:soluble lytic murein transglycosylase-like protein/cellobiose-specific phosphotransferase system component IIA